MAINVRRAAASDEDDLYILMKQYITDFYKKEEPAEKDLKGHIRHLLSQPNEGLQFVAEENGRPLGFATLYFSYSTLQLKRQAIMNDLFVAEDARGKRIGEQLFRACLAYVREHDLAYMLWETGRDNTKAQAFYKKMGAEPAEQVFYEME
ncbi:GNAT family N-acetyltransferase [Indiicoccus explosivorum]|uniref:GNAT family N-acetyltransferase n=1 Tax=Indiicoccus explosivorum TaxID=1917864 RepID=UPI000B44F54F|nr:GNAT family N-acetyltransferase [Indiicoccus explosivorum]